MKCSMLHFIWVFTVCQSTCLGLSSIQWVKFAGSGSLHFTIADPFITLKNYWVLNENVQPSVDCEAATPYSTIFFENLGEYFVGLM